jgi:hypothetical protein
MCVELNELSEDWIGAHVYSIHNFLEVHVQLLSTIVYIFVQL